MVIPSGQWTRLDPWAGDVHTQTPNRNTHVIRLFLSSPCVAALFRKLIDDLDFSLLEAGGQFVKQRASPIILPHIQGLRCQNALRPTE